MKRAANASPASSSPRSEAPLGDRLRELAEHHQLRERRQRPGPPALGRAAEALDQLGRELEREALVAAHVLVRTDVLLPRVPDEDRARDQLVGLAAGPVAEAALADVGEVEAAVLLDERRDVPVRVAAVVDHRERVALPKRGGGHDAFDLAAPRRSGNRGNGRNGRTIAPDSATATVGKRERWRGRRRVLRSRSARTARRRANGGSLRDRRIEEPHGTRQAAGARARLSGWRS